MKKYTQEGMNIPKIGRNVMKHISKTGCWKRWNTEEQQDSYPEHYDLGEDLSLLYDLVLKVLGKGIQKTKIGGVKVELLYKLVQQKDMEKIPSGTFYRELLRIQMRSMMNKQRT